MSPTDTTEGAAGVTESPGSAVVEAPRGSFLKSRVAQSGSLVRAARDYGIGLFVIGLFVGLAFSSSAFLTGPNLKNMIDQAVATGLLSCAGTLVIIAGGFDLSAGGIFMVAAVVGAHFINATGIGAGMLIALALGCFLGLVNGFLTTYAKLDHFVATLGTSIAYGGLAVAISNGNLILINKASFANLAGTDILGFNSSTVIMVVFALLCGVLLNKTVFGRRIYTTGGNVEAARTAGVPVTRVIVTVYAISGVTAALAGLIILSRTSSITGTNGLDVIFPVFAAILIGGNTMGQGSIWRAMVGVFILALINNGFNLLGFNPYYQDIVTGALIVVAIAADKWARART